MERRAAAAQDLRYHIANQALDREDTTGYRLLPYDELEDRMMVLDKLRNLVFSIEIRLIRDAGEGTPLGPVGDPALGNIDDDPADYLENGGVL